jgi:hypothetical protein
MLKYNTLKATEYNYTNAICTSIAIPKHINQKIIKNKINGLNALLVSLFYSKRDKILVLPISKSRFLVIVSQFHKLLQFWSKLRLLTQKIVIFSPDFDFEQSIQKFITF